MLEEKQGAYKKEERIPRPTPAKYKKEFPFLKEVDCFALVAVQNHIENASEIISKIKSNSNYRSSKRKEKNNLTLPTILTIR